ncbi:MAG: hypothetical protein JWN57_1769, partial [Frankiales bacterium]|nr:hypothetical protein [Frankiales bacterium]
EAASGPVAPGEAQARAAEAPGGDTGEDPVRPAPAPEAPLTPPALPETVAGPLDEACLAAVDLARAAAVQEGGPSVGEPLDVQGEPDPGAALVTHLFATTDRAYAGWRWAVTVVRAAGSDIVTVDEVVLLPGPDALLPPAWVPYSDRVQPGDLSPGDVLPPAVDDPRLVPSHADPESDDDAELLAEAFLELGLGRERVLSREGREEAAERWWNGDAGPHSPLAKAAPADCGSCGFLVPLGGSLRAAFGACANAFAPDDGRVVALTHGCGAHSEVAHELTHVAQSGMAVEHEELEVEHNAPTAGEASQESLSEDESESLGHS